MAKNRIKDRTRPSVYHVTFRIVGGQHLLTPEWKEIFIDKMWWVSDYCGVEVYTYCMMSNHGHGVIGTPSLEEVMALPDAELVRRVGVCRGHGDPGYRRLQEELEWHGRLTETSRKPWLARMGDISMFMKDLKQRFSVHYNVVNKRFGTLYAERFGSQLHRLQPEEVIPVALYDELNPVRAGLVEDPKDYPYCGYAAAVNGDERVRKNLTWLMNAGRWEEAQAEYRQRLFVRGVWSRDPEKAAIPREKVDEVLREKGALESPPQQQDPSASAEPEEKQSNQNVPPAGWTHNPQATRSGAVGSLEYILELMKNHPQLRGPRRKGPIKIQGLGHDNLWGLKRPRPRRQDKKENKKPPDKPDPDPPDPPPPG